METMPHDHSGSDATPEVANRGMARPPLGDGAAMVTGVFLELGWPLPFLPRLLTALLGSVLVVLAVVVFSYSIRTFQTAGTPVPGNKPTTVIVRTGPYRFSRNPIYLAFSLFQLGLALWVNSLILLLTLVPAVALMSFVVIPREERYLGVRFSSEYASYKASVRRWL